MLKKCRFLVFFRKDGLITGLFLLCTVGISQATLVTIGTATYNNSTYKLIYDDDTGHGSGGLVWLDYTKAVLNWYSQRHWLADLNDPGVIICNLNPGMTMDWTGTWRLPDTVDGYDVPDIVDGYDVSGYEGDPNNDGIYTYTEGWNLANSEWGHLFHEELGNLSEKDTSGNYIPSWEYGLLKTGDFENLVDGKYWSETIYSYSPNRAWYFNNLYGYQASDDRSLYSYYGCSTSRAIK